MLTKFLQLFKHPCWLTLFHVLLSVSITVAQGRQQASNPVKLIVKPNAKSYPIGAKATIDVILNDINNKEVKAAKEYIIEIEIVRSFPPPQTRKKMLDTINVGETSAKFQLALEESGLLEIYARHQAKIPELLPGDTPISVKRASRSLRKPPSGAGIPGLNGHFLGAGMLASPRFYQLVSEQGTYLILKSSPQRILLADGKDAATIHIFYYSEEGIAPSDIRVRLFNSSGKLEPAQTLLIPKGEDYSQAVLTSNQVGAVNVEFLGSIPSYNAQGESKLQIKFGPPITQIIVNASPPSISLVDQADLIVHLLNEKGTPIASDTARQISFAIEQGRGEIEKKELEIPAGRSQGRTVFLPTWMGKVTVSASTPDLQPATVSLQVAPPTMLLSLTALGGLAGGLIAFWTRQNSKWWRIVIGLIAGFVFYWAFTFGVLNAISRAIVLNPLSAFALSTLGGWLGTEVFTLILKRFGIST
jgi:hypothetical protein